LPDTLGRLRREAREAARHAGVSARDVDLLLADLIGRDPVYVVAGDDRVVTDEQRARFEDQLRRRLGGEPVQYIRGRCEFFGRTFLVDSRVLIPRPETETICERVLDIVRPGMRVIDVGCGSGAIAVTLALECRGLRVLATDRSLDAIVLARQNAQRLGARVAFAQGDLLAATRGRFVVIVSNPPYVPDEDFAGLQREVVEHEPRMALSGGRGGMVVIARLVVEAATRLESGGSLVMEIGWNQADRLVTLGREQGLDVEIHDDLAGVPRCGVLRRRVTRDERRATRDGGE
jgi:release factor glutamine methyltransferase